jgi:hypothetical protein
MLSCEEHLENLVRHIDMVRQAGLLLGKRLMAKERKDFGRLLIARCYEHDVSKFYGIEWRFLHAGKDMDKEDLERAVQQHVETNAHHPEYHGGFNNMGEMDVAELLVDWYARSQEFGTGLRDWIKNSAIDRFKINVESDQYRWLSGFLDILLEDHFVR